MIGIILEIIIAALVGAILLYLLITARNKDVRKQAGWGFIIGGVRLQILLDKIGLKVKR